MPIETKDTDNGLGVFFIGRGIVGEIEYLDIYKKHLSQDKDKYQKYRYGINDWSEVTGVEISSNAIDKIAGLCIYSAKINPYPVIAHIATTDVTYGLSRMWEFLSSETEWEIMVFRRRNEAKGWIRERLRDKFGIDDLTFT